MRDDLVGRLRVAAAGANDLLGELLDEAADEIEVRSRGLCGTTHAEDCWSWGPRHWECAVAKIEEMEEPTTTPRPGRDL